MCLRVSAEGSVDIDERWGGMSQYVPVYGWFVSCLHLRRI